MLQLQEVAEVLLGEVLPLVLLELWHGWEGHGGVERVGTWALTSSKKCWGPQGLGVNFDSFAN